MLKYIQSNDSSVFLEKVNNSCFHGSHLLLHFLADLTDLLLSILSVLLEGRKELVGHNLVSLVNEVLHFVTTSLVFWCSHDHLVEVGELHLLVQNDQAFEVEFTSVHVLLLSLLAHNILVRARDDGDKEVEEDDQDQVLVNEPEHPDHADHNFSLPNVAISDELLPEWVSWCCDISDRVSVSLEEVHKLGAHLWVVSTIEDNSRNLVELTEIEHPSAKVNVEGLGVTDTSGN